MIARSARKFAVAFLATLAVALAARAAFGEDGAVPGDPFWIVARFPAGAATVTADVLEIGGAQVANNLAATRAQLDGSPTDAFALNLATMPGFPLVCERKAYLVRWTPDSADCSASGTPAACPADVVEVGGPSCRANPIVQTSIETTESPIAAQGITRAVIDYHLRRGERVERWRRIDVAGSGGSFASPSSTRWEVYFYHQTGSYPRRKCAVVTTTNPATTLPSDAVCGGS